MNSVERFKAQQVPPMEVPTLRQLASAVVPVPRDGGMTPNLSIKPKVLEAFNVIRDRIDGWDDAEWLWHTTKARYAAPDIILERTEDAPYEWRLVYEEEVPEVDELCWLWSPPNGDGDLIP